MKYPKIGERYKVFPKGLCTVCGKPRSDAEVTIEVNGFRGDDEVCKVHWVCIRKLNDAELLVILLRKGSV